MAAGFTSATRNRSSIIRAASSFVAEPFIRRYLHDTTKKTVSGQRYERGPEPIYLQQLGVHAVRILPGEAHTTDKKDEAIVTVLGSCVSACIRDPRSGVGGMNHFMLPESATGQWGEQLSAAGALRQFCNGGFDQRRAEIAALAGKALEIKLFGGANFTAGTTRIGDKNADFAIKYLQNEGLRVAASDLGGILGRRIEYHPATGGLRVYS